MATSPTKGIKIFRENEKKMQKYGRERYKNILEHEKRRLVKYRNNGHKIW